MKNRLFALVAFCLAIVSPGLWSSEVKDYESTIALFKQHSLVNKYFDSAYGYALFPLVGKGSFILGYTRGTGQVYRGRT